ncbi:MAG: hypothetical protein U1F43_37840 [Myxococcota bacterium]
MTAALRSRGWVPRKVDGVVLPVHRIRGTDAEVVSVWSLAAASPGDRDVARAVLRAVLAPFVVRVRVARGRFMDAVPVEVLGAAVVS